MESQLLPPCKTPGSRGRRILMASAGGGVAVDGGVAATLWGLLFEGSLVDLNDQLGRVGAVSVNKIDEQFSGDGTGRFGNFQAEQDRDRMRPRTGPRISRSGLNEAKIPLGVGSAHNKTHIVGKCFRVSAVLRRSEGELSGVVVASGRSARWAPSSLGFGRRRSIRQESLRSGPASIDDTSGDVPSLRISEKEFTPFWAESKKVSDKLCRKAC